MPKHTLAQFDTDLDELKRLTHSMFKITRKNIKQSLKALIEGNTELAQKVITQDDAIDALEVQADEVARNIIVQHQPTASDLRFVFAATKIVTDLERLGDMAVTIAENVIAIDGVISKNLASIPVMQELILDQMKIVRHAFQESDAQQAQSVLERTPLINKCFVNTQRVMLTYMAENPANISLCVELINIAKMLERIGDHIANIAEMVIYSAIGYEVRHIDAADIKELLAGGDDE